MCPKLATMAICYANAVAETFPIYGLVGKDYREKCIEAMVSCFDCVIKVLHSSTLKDSTRQYHTFHGECMATAR